MNNRNSANHAANVKRYVSKQRQYLILVNPERDADIVSWFDSQSNKNKAVRTLIRQSLRKRRTQINSTNNLRQKRKAAGLCIYCGKADARTETGKSVCQTCTDRATERRHSKCAK